MRLEHDFDGVQTVIDRWLQQHPDSAAAYEARALQMEQGGRLAAAEEFADLALGRDPQRHGAQETKLRAELRRDAAAAFARSEALLANARTPEQTRSALLWQGHALDRLQDWPEAAERWLRAQGLPQRTRGLPDLVEGEPTIELQEGPAPSLLWGPPGSAIMEVVALLRGVAERVVLDDRFGAGPRPDGLGPPRADGVLVNRSGWTQILQRRGFAPEHVIDWMLHWDAQLEAALGGTRLIAVLSDPRDLLLNWLAFGSRQQYTFAGQEAAAEWLAGALRPLAERLRGHAALCLIRDSELVDAPAQVAERLAAFLQLPATPDPRAAAAANRGLGELPLHFAPGHWHHYAQPLAAGFERLRAVAADLGYGEA